MSDLPIEPPSVGGTTDEADTSGLAQTMAVAMEDEREPLTLRQVSVDSVTPAVGEASVCTVRIGAGAPQANIRYLGEPPAVGDSAWLLTNGPDRLVLGALAYAVPVGVIMWIGGTGGAPPGWWPCDGRSTAGYPKLVARYGGNIPDLRNRFVVASGSDYAVGATGGAASTTDVPSHSHSGFNHTHTGPSHTHPGFHHNHSVPDHSHPQVVTAGSGGPASRIDYDADDSGQVYPQGVNTGGSGTLTTGSDGGAYFTGSGGNQATSSDGAGSTTGSTGVGGGIENRPPFYALLAIIKFG